MSNVLDVLFSLRRYLDPTLHIGQLVIEFVIKTLIFWTVNSLLHSFGVEHFGFVAAFCFSAFTSIFSAIRMYSAGKKYYLKIKNSVISTMA